MNKLFNNKANLLALGLAAAAIFAVTFVACDNGTTSEGWGGLGGPGDIVVWKMMGGTEDNYEYELIQFKGASGNFTGTPGAYYQYLTTIPASTLKSSLADKTDATAAVDIYEVTSYPSAGGKQVEYVAGNKLADYSASAGWYTLGAKVATGTAGTGAAGITNPSASTTDIYEVTRYTAAGGAKDVHYVAATQVSEYTKATTLVSVLGSKVATGVAGGGSAGITNPSASTTDIYEVTIYTAAGGAKDVQYVAAAGVSDLTKATTLVSVLGNKVATGVAGTGSAGIANKTDDTAATDIYEVTIYTAAGGPKVVSYVAGSALLDATKTNTLVSVLGDKVASFGEYLAK